MGLTSAPSIFRIAIFASLVAMFPTGCHRPTGAEEKAGGPLEVAWAGCAGMVVKGGVTICEIGEKAPPTLRLVLPEAATNVVVTSGAQVLAVVREDAGPGSPSSGGSARIAVEVPDHASSIAVRAEVGGRSARFELPVARAPKVAWLEEAKGARGKGKLAEARALVEPHLATDARAKSLLARIVLAEGRADDAFPIFREAVAAHRVSGRVSDVVDDSFALAFALHQRSHRYAEARAALDGIAGDLAGYPEGRARAPYYRGILASETGDRRAALALLREAGDRARVLGMGRLERNARAALALEMQTVGRTAEALGVLRALERDPDVQGCERVEIENDVGWGEILVAETTGEPRPEARAALERATKLSCSDAFLASSTLANLARLELDDGNVEAARQRLAAARRAVPEPRGTERLAWLDLDARIAAQSGDPRGALAKIDEELALARRFALVEHEWSAHTLRAEVLEALHRGEDAAAAALLAEALVDRMMVLVPLGGGRGAFVSERSRSARVAVDLLVARGHIPDAVRVARRSRARVLTGVERALRIERLSTNDRATWEASVRAYRDARAALDDDATKDWTLPAESLAQATEARRERAQSARDALEAAIHRLSTAASSDGADTHVVPEGDVELLVHPGRAAWWAFAIDDRTAIAQRVPSTEAELGPKTPGLEAIRFRLKNKKRLHLLPYGAWRSFDIEKWLLGGDPARAAMEIDYPLGLGTTERDDARAAAPALVVGDPRSDLPHARAEATAVAKAIGAARKTDLRLGDDATTKALGDALPVAGLLHYAGHGVYAGVEGFESALPLAGGGVLSLGDLLALPSAPRKVVLSGCDAGKSAGAAEGLGLAQALVLAGSDEVLAPIRPVPDALATRLAARLYEGDAGAALLRLERGALRAAAHAALAKLRAEDDAGDWAAFRVIAR